MGRRRAAADAGLHRRRVRRHRPLTRDAGSAVVDVALVSILLAVLFLGVVQLALALHVRNVLVDAAGEGARHGALEGQTPAAGEQRARVLITAALTPRFAKDVTSESQPVPGGDLVVVTVEAPLPVLGLSGPRTLEVSGRALREPS